MGRLRGPVCRLCRRGGMKLFLKGSRCLSTKCSFEKRSYPPGMAGLKGQKLTDYGLQLREKQRLRYTYGLLEKQFKRYFKIASQKKGVIGENFITLLESRLDNIVYRLGWAESRAEARQIVGHGHIRVNGKGVNIPSFQVKPGDVISVKKKKRNVERMKETMKLTEGRGIPEWLERDSEELTGRLLRLPKREEIELPINEELIVAFYSK